MSSVATAPRKRAAAKRSRRAERVVDGSGRSLRPRRQRGAVRSGRADAAERWEAAPEKACESVHRVLSLLSRRTRLAAAARAEAALRDGTADALFWRVMRGKAQFFKPVVPRASAAVLVARSSVSRGISGSHRRVALRTAAAQRGRGRG